MQDLNNKAEQFKAHRRQILRMGAAGLPMVLTLRASASGAVISQLRCAFTIPCGVKILVDDTGQAWMGERNIRQRNGKFKTTSLDKFKSKADFVFPAGSVPSKYRADACETSSRGNDCGWGNDIDDPVGDNNDQDSCPADPPRQTPWFEEEDQDGEPGNRPDPYSGNGNDSNKGGKGNSKWTDCGYKLYDYCNSTINPGDFVTSGGNWNISGNEGLYISLSLQYAENHNTAGNWPGISCIVSIINYLNL